ncbi:cell division protein FtsL [Niveispirillum irakense]|uniref:cell division protein FtsL n=1 Tax=Niveispirillum irakense TaxID=34011 RepID=UPI00041DE014|nr:hypothetical protein [Niveispirillum irakense]
MIGKSTIIWIGVTCAASGILYQTSYKAQEQERELARLNREIRAEHANIQVLKAEWAYLNDPAALEKMSAQHLLLGHTKAEQIAMLTDIPDRQPGEAAPLTPIPGRKPGAPRHQAPMPAPEAQIAAVPSTTTSHRDMPVVLVNYGARQ